MINKQKAPLPKIRYSYPTMMKFDIWAKEDPKICKSSETPIKFCKYQRFSPDTSNFRYIEK